MRYFDRLVDAVFKSTTVIIIASDLIDANGLRTSFKLPAMWIASDYTIFEAPGPEQQLEKFHTHKV